MVNMNIFLLCIGTLEVNFMHRRMMDGRTKVFNILTISTSNTNIKHFSVFVVIPEDQHKTGVNQSFCVYQEIIHKIFNRHKTR
jgi:hypothetical protein